MTVKSPRLAAFETLYKIQQESAYSNLSLDHLPVANGQERAFATALVRGVLERQITLDALVDKFTTGRYCVWAPTRRCIWTRCLCLLR